MTRLSIAIPLYNEQEVLPELLRRVGAVLDQIPDGPHEIVIADDGSSDDTPRLLNAAADADPRLVVVTLSRNFGHQAALTAALDHATGDAVVLMDGDLQDPPEAVPTFLAHHAAGFDVVYAQRVQRKESWLLRLSYFIFYRLALRLADLRLPLDAGDFGLMSRRVVDHIRAAPERNRYLRGLRVWAGFRQIGVPVERDARAAGSSKYSILKLLRLASDGIFAFSIVPLRAAALVGAAAIALAFVFAVYALYARLVLDRSPAGFTALTILVTFLSGVNIFFVGVIGEYVGRIYEEVKARPIYVVARLKRGS
ncbi:MAG TPA: glycosyltransferase family 2 protein [Gemmatimonadaceae bacterium]|nr:glycosyltransferase family 2 protein [Gemmatimonadaceae bacterium]